MKKVKKEKFSIWLLQLLLLASSQQNRNTNNLSVNISLYLNATLIKFYEKKHMIMLKKFSSVSFIIINIGKNIYYSELLLLY